MKIDLLEFVDSTGFRKGIERPWSVGDFTYASDGRIMLRVATSVCPSEPNDQAPKKATTMFKWEHDSVENWIGIASLPGAKKQECGECYGGGEHECSCGNHHECKACGGEGQINEGRGRNELQIGQSIFDVFYLRKIKALPGAVVHPPAKASEMMFFKFDGGLGYLMPLKKEP